MKWEVIDVGPHAGASITERGWTNDLDVMLRKGTRLALIRWVFSYPAGWHCVGLMVQDCGGAPVLTFSGLTTGMHEAIWKAVQVYLADKPGGRDATDWPGWPDRKIKAGGGRKV